MNNNKNKKKFNFKLISEHTFCISGHFDAFTEERKNLIKQHGGVYNGEEKVWIVSKEQRDYLRENLQNQNSSIQINDIPQLAFDLIQPFPQEIVIKEKKSQTIVSYTKEDKDKDINMIPLTLRLKLYQFQKESIERGLKNYGRILIGDEMGIGKTVQSLALSVCYKEKWPLLVICPSSLRLNWKSEVLKWFPDLTPQDIKVINKGNQVISDNKQVIIVSYDLSPKYIEDFEEKSLKIAIVDEAHYLKNSQAQRTKALMPFLQKLQHIILLSGTPAFARPKEIFTLLSILRPDIFNDFITYGNRYCDPKPSYFKRGLDYDGSSNSKELFFILNQKIMIRRLKKDVLSQLPDKRRQLVHIGVDNNIVKEISQILSQHGKNDVSELMEDMYQQNYEKYIEGNHQPQQISENQNRQEQSIFQAFNKCYILTGQAKIKGIQNYLQEIIENEIKFIFFAHHTVVLDEIESYIASKKIKSIRIDGNVSHEKRHERVEAFQKNDDIKAAILSLTAAGVGLTLTACSNIIFGEMHMTPAVMLQAEDRAHRIGQANSVNCHYLIGEETLDQKLYFKLEQKLDTTSQFLDGQSQKLQAKRYYTKGEKKSIIEKKVEISKKVVKGMKTLENFFEPVYMRNFLDEIFDRKMIKFFLNFL